MKYLENLPNLRVLWLDGNPCCSHPNYRLYILKVLPNLDKIDTNAVTTEERMTAKKMDLTTLGQTDGEDVRMDEDVEERKMPDPNVIKKDLISITKS